MFDQIGKQISVSECIVRGFAATASVHHLKLRQFTSNEFISSAFYSQFTCEFMSNLVFCTRSLVMKRTIAQTTQFIRF